MINILGPIRAKVRPPSRPRRHSHPRLPALRHVRRRGAHRQAGGRAHRARLAYHLKFTRIKDWRLAVFFYFCQLAVLVGIVASLIIGKTFLALEVPIGVISSYASTPTAYAEHRRRRRPGPSPRPAATWYVPARERNARFPPDPRSHVSKRVDLNNHRKRSSIASPLGVLGR